MTKSRSVLVIALFFCGTLLAASCGDDSTPEPTGADPTVGTDPGATTAPTTPTTPTTIANPTTAPATTAAAPDPEAVSAEATLAFESFFNTLGALEFDQTATYLENGAAHTSEFQGFADLAAGVGAVVTDVEVLDDTLAIVTYNIVFGEEIALEGSSGEAVLIDGRWLMSEGTWNALAALAPPPEE